MNTLHIYVRRNLPRNDWYWTAVAHRIGATSWRESDWIGNCHGNTRAEAISNLERYLESASLASTPKGAC